MKPSLAGICARIACSRASRRSGVAISISNVSAIADLLTNFLCLLLHVLDVALHVERLLGKIVVLAVYYFFETANGVRERDVFSRNAGELLGHVERLRQEPLNLTGSSDDGLVVV